MVKTMGTNTEVLTTGLVKTPGINTEVLTTDRAGKTTGTNRGFDYRAGKNHGY
jgi:hypothetical protein